MFDRVLSEYATRYYDDDHYVKSVQIHTEYLSVFSTNAGKYGPEKTPYLDTFYAVDAFLQYSHIELLTQDYLAVCFLNTHLRNFVIENL